MERLLARAHGGVESTANTICSHSGSITVFVVDVLQPCYSVRTHYRAATMERLLALHMVTWNPSFEMNYLKFKLPHYNTKSFFLNVQNYKESLTPLSSNTIIYEGL